VQHRHAKHCIQTDQAFRIECDQECNIQLMDDANYEYFTAGHTSRYFGELCRRGFPATLKPPAAGCWNVVISPVKLGQIYTYHISVVSSHTFRI
jgi:Domain of unknown function (DUF1883)